MAPDVTTSGRASAAANPRARLRALDQPQQENQDDRADQCDDDRAEQAAARRHAHRAEQPAADQRADDADDDDADDAVAAAFHDDPREPSGDEADDDEPDEFHGLLPQQAFGSPTIGCYAAPGKIGQSDTGSRRRFLPFLVAANPAMSASTRYAKVSVLPATRLMAWTCGKRSTGRSRMSVRATSFRRAGSVSSSM